MASPIRWFRKHSQFFIVVFGVVLMAIFGLGSVMSSLNPADFAGGTEVENPVIAEWAGGELTNQELYRMRRAHFASQRLVRNVYKYAVDQNGGNQFQPSAQILPPIDPGAANPTDALYNAEVLNRFLMAEQAKAEGFIVDEDMAYQYVLQFAGEAGLSRDQLKQLNREVNNEFPLTAVIRHLQTELLWQQMENMATSGFAFALAGNVPYRFSAVSPTEAMELYARVNRKIECRVLPVSVEEYLSKVGEPTDSDLKPIFEEGRYQYARLNFEEPGFKQPPKAKIQYFIAEMETFLQNEMAKLSDEEVQAEYDRLVEEEDNLVMQLVPQNDEAKADGATDGEGLDDAASANDEDSVPVEQDDPAPAMEDDDPAPALIDDESNTNASEESGNEAESNPETDDNDGEDSDEDSTSGGYTSLKLQAEEATSDSSQEPDEESGKDSGDSDKSTGESQQDDASTTEGSESTQEQSDESGASDATSTEEESPEVADTDTEQVDDPVIEDEKPQREPKPIQDVAEDIRRRLSTEAAREALDKVVDAIDDELRKFQKKRSSWEFEKEREKDTELEMPVPPDYKALADQYGVQFLETGLVDVNEVQKEKIGEVARIDFVNQRPMPVNIANEIFTQLEATSLYQHRSADDFRNSSKVIYWLSEKVKQKVPTFEEARDSVVKYWKHNQSIELALKNASEIADQLKASGTTLADKYPEKSKDTGAFSWFSTFGRFGYGSPVGVVDAGEDFMKSAFSLESGGLTTALNGARDTAYVIQMTKEPDTSLEEVGTEYLEKKFFLTNRIPQEVIQAKAEYRIEENGKWLTDLLEKMDVKVVGQ